MPRGGVNELLKSSDGRRYLGELQRRYKDDLEQPVDRRTGKPNPRFYQLYGKKLKYQQDVYERDVRDSKDQHAELADRKKFDDKNKR